jgi:tetratricopeptide (TPR) repeat protein
MQEQRLKILEEYYREDPNDPFNGYALAMEYLAFNKDKAAELLKILYVNFPDYLPVYYQLAQYYFQNDNFIEAEEVFVKGIRLASAQKNSKTEKELLGAYRLFKDETEEW